MKNALLDFPLVGPPFVVTTYLNSFVSAKTLIDGGCMTFGLISSKLVDRFQLPRLPCSDYQLTGFASTMKKRANEVTCAYLDVGGVHEQKAFFFIVPHLDNYDLILGRPWMQRHHVLEDHPADILTFQEAGVTIANEWQRDLPSEIDCKPVGAAAFARLAARTAKIQKTPPEADAAVFAVSLSDIEKALEVRKHVDPRQLLPEEFHPWLDVFDRRLAEALPPLRGPEVDHRIELEKDDHGKEKELPWGPMYSMGRDQLLVLRKTLDDYLTKEQIRVSSSPAGAPVLFVKKPGGGLRFCVDYRALNAITKKDRYPLPLIKETLNAICKAKWFTKLDVIAAFNKIRIDPRDVQKTAFRTRYGLFEWLVMPFGLANAPSTFQRYINSVLREYLDVFVSAYIDDILIYTDGSREDHVKHVKMVLEKLRKAGLQIDISKCEFCVKKTKYLGFIIEAEKGISMDPEKVEAVQNWQPPKTVKGVRAFLGFANFYRRFIKNFSAIAKPLTDLTKASSAAFRLPSDALRAFQELKSLFCTAPLLAHFDPERETTVEADASGWATGGVLSQKDETGSLRPVAFFSKKLNPAEVNYEIYDKEMLAIIRCLKEWSAELHGVDKFSIATDHKNLEFFKTTQKLTERHMRWSQVLSEFNFTLTYRPGPQGVIPDVLSRLEQDKPQDADDDRLKGRQLQLLKPSMFAQVATAVPLKRHPQVVIRTHRRHRTPSPPLDLPTSPEPLQPPEETPQLSDNDTPPFPDVYELGDSPLQQLWNDALLKDDEYAAVKNAVLNEARQIPRELELSLSISDCSVDTLGRLCYRKRYWVPKSEPLRTGIIQHYHDCLFAGHPGREALAASFRRRFWFPNADKEIRRFCKACPSCGRNRTWNDRHQGLLQPLPIPEQFWKEISMDFITGLPLSRGNDSVMVITDRLGKGIIVEAMKNTTAPYVARKFLNRYVRRHGIPTAITSDRGSQFVGNLWTRLCERLKIKQRLSTAYHPETDGATERANQKLEEYLRHYSTLHQDNWADLLGLAELALNNRDAAATKISPFFIEHGYHARLGEGLDLDDVPTRQIRQRQNPAEAADALLQKVRELTTMAQTMMADSQERYEQQANKTRQPAPRYNVGDWVWLDLRNWRLEEVVENGVTVRRVKKLAPKYERFKVLQRISPLAYRLDVPGDVHNVFHTKLLRPGNLNPLPSQKSDDWRPGPILLNGGPEFGVEEILSERTKRLPGTRNRTKREFLVKWVGWPTPTWEAASNLQEVEALDRWEALATQKQNTPTSTRQRLRPSVNTCYAYRGEETEEGGIVTG